jgi:hypothetical protein
MSDLSGAAMGVLFCGLVYLRFGSKVRVKRWLLPLVCIGLGAIFAIFFGRNFGFVGYFMSVALGAVLYMQFRYCRYCGQIKLSQWSFGGQLSNKSITSCKRCGRSYVP